MKASLRSRAIQAVPYLLMGAGAWLLFQGARDFFESRFGQQQAARAKPTAVMFTPRRRSARASDAFSSRGWERSSTWWRAMARRNSGAVPGIFKAR